jgi:RNA recognition motif-containing protein
MSQSKIYVGNLSYSVGEKELSDHFGQFGAIKELILIKDRETGRSKGFGFVEFNTAAEADKAIQGSQGFDLGGRAMNVNIARERDPNAPRTGGRPGGMRSGRPGGRPGGFGGRRDRDEF